MKKLTEEDKKKIYEFLVYAYIELVRKNIIGKVERKVLAQKILDAVESAQNSADIYNFINTLTKTYTFFQPAAVLVKSNFDKYEEEKVINHLENYINNFNIQKI